MYIYEHFYPSDASLNSQCMCVVCDCAAAAVRVLVHFKASEEEGGV